MYASSNLFTSNQPAFFKISSSSIPVKQIFCVKDYDPFSSAPHKWQIHSTAGSWEHMIVLLSYSDYMWKKLVMLHFVAAIICCTALWYRFIIIYLPPSLPLHSLTATCYYTCFTFFLSYIIFGSFRLIHKQLSCYFKVGISFFSYKGHCPRLHHLCNSNNHCQTLHSCLATFVSLLSYIFSKKSLSAPIVVCDQAK